MTHLARKFPRAPSPLRALCNLDAATFIGPLQVPAWFKASVIRVCRVRGYTCAVTSGGLELSSFVDRHCRGWMSAFGKQLSLT